MNPRVINLDQIKEALAKIDSDTWADISIQDILSLLTSKSVPLPEKKKLRITYPGMDSLEYESAMADASYNQAIDEIVSDLKKLEKKN